MRGFSVYTCCLVLACLWFVDTAAIAVPALRIAMNQMAWTSESHRKLTDTGRLHSSGFPPNHACSSNDDCASEKCRQEKCECEHDSDCSSFGKGWTCFDPGLGARRNRCEAPAGTAKIAIAIASRMWIAPRTSAMSSTLGAKTRASVRKTAIVRGPPAIIARIQNRSVVRIATRRLPRGTIALPARRRSHPTTTAYSAPPLQGTFVRPSVWCGVCVPVCVCLCVCASVEGARANHNARAANRTTAATCPTALATR